MSENEKADQKATVQENMELEYAVQQKKQRDLKITNLFTLLLVFLLGLLLGFLWRNITKNKFVEQCQEEQRNNVEKGLPVVEQSEVAGELLVAAKLSARGDRTVNGEEIEHARKPNPSNCCNAKAVVVDKGVLVLEELTGIILLLGISKTSFCGIDIE